MTVTDNMDAPDAMEEAPLLNHLIELRTRLMLCVLALLVAMGVSYTFAEEMYAFLIAPLTSQFEGGSHRLIYTHLTEAFFTYLKLAFYGGLALSFPIICWQMFAFIAPGLYANEKRLFVLFLIAAPVLFIAGIALAYYGVFPLAWKFFLSFEQSATASMPAIQLEAKISEYLSLVLQMMLAFGLSFQLPIIMLLLVRAGLVEVAALRRFRRYMVVLVFATAAIFTPPDLISQIALAIPLICLYEGTLLICRWLQPKPVPDAAQPSDLEEAGTHHA